MKIIFATNNKNKLLEIKQIVQQGIEILSLEDIGFKGDIPETKATIEGNALQKAAFIFDRYQIPVFADDTGLEVDALNGEPGVYSARYAGNDCTSEDNIQLLLKNLEGVSNRNAQFKTIIAFQLDQHTTHCFEGIVKGNITDKKQGVSGFGYDPVFTPMDYQVTFAEMPSEEKNKISHRGIATRKFVEFVRQKL